MEGDIVIIKYAGAYSRALLQGFFIEHAPAVYSYDSWGIRYSSRIYSARFLRDSGLREAILKAWVSDKGPFAFVPVVRRLVLVRDLLFAVKVML